MKCRYCDRDMPIPCMNSRDMTDFAIGGEDVCLAALEKNGWGESGERYVRLNRERVAESAGRDRAPDKRKPPEDRSPGSSKHHLTIHFDG